MKMIDDALMIIEQTLKDSKPSVAIKKAYASINTNKKIYVIALGKAAWEMANTFHDDMGEHIKKGIVITKYKHSEGRINNFEIIEAGHPMVDQNSVYAANKAIELVKDLDENDLLVMLLSGGGSSLMEKPLDGVEFEEIVDLNDKLLKSGADIVEINSVRKHLSSVKGGRLSALCPNTEIINIILSDVLDNKIDTIASGPTIADESTTEDAIKVLRKYDININDRMMNAINEETPKRISNSSNIVLLNVENLCEITASEAKALGYKPKILATDIRCEARDAGSFIASIAKYVSKRVVEPTALIFGGETVVKVKGKGKGGRNQELILSSLIEIANTENVLIFSIGSDGTDGPTEYAGAYTTGDYYYKLKKRGLSPEDYLKNNDSSSILESINALIYTGATGTNINDVTVVLIGNN